mmetsp:Transcript_7683/g.18518  ORF Transcript_7683/g.18518 Transcript_7683/m.18518 type:complete len:930 (+) Transcript_7683:77-2866(+)
MLGDDPFENKHPRTTATTSSGSGSRAVFLDEGIPSKAIWDPSSSVSDSSSVASIASISVASVESNHIINSSTDEYLDHHHQQQQREPQGPGNSVPYSAPTEHNLRMRIYNDDNNNDGDDRGGGTSSNNYDDDRLSAMLTNSINSAHARSNDTSIDVGSSSNINEMILPTPLRDERHRFIQSLSHLTDKQLRTRLWDSFRLARIILGKPVKEKRRLSHKSILHAIRKVAEMKIHIVNLSKELDGYRQHEKKASIAATATTRSNNNDEQKQQAAGIGTNEEKDNPNNKSIDSMSVSMSSYATVSSFTASVTSVRDVISDSNSTDRNVSNLREEALRILKEEADQALDQLHEFELLHLQDEEDTGSGPSGPSPVRDGGNDESNNNNADPVSLFLSPSNSIEDDDAVYADDFSHDDEGNESASDILEAFRETGTTTTRAQQQSQQQQEANRPLPMNTAQQQQQQQQKSTQASRVASFPAVVAKSSSSSSDKDEILRVLGHVKALQQTNQQGINREIPSSASAVHEEVIALLTRLAQNQTPPQKTSVVSIGTKHETQDVFEDDEEEDDDDDDEENIPGNHLTRQLRRGRRNVEDDNKSHMSELTEERTQKQFDAAMLLYSANPQLRAAMAGSPRMGPPTIIGIAEESGDQSGPGASAKSTSGREKLDTIGSNTRASQRPPSGTSNHNNSNNGRIVSRKGNITTESTPSRRRSSSGRRDVSNDRLSLDTAEVGSLTSINTPTTKKLSVAQRARLEADRQSTPVRLHMNQTPLRGNKHSNNYRESPSVNSQQSGFFSRFGKRFEEAVDKSVLGVDLDASSDENSSSGDSYEGNQSSRYTSSGGNTDVDTDGDFMEDEKKMPERSSVASTSASLSLADRQALQRAQQLKFLKDQGLINKESDVRGGAGGDAQSVNSRTSRTSRASRASRTSSRITSS